ncbi:MAG: glycosyltransferase family 2 protein [Gammaproteobacteria bacterium]|nr:glycosyltransferase family 2 protein [Gammaproteobacteria bacterium]MBU1722379.1 glycosyltransferase family 2 protein [Gammaproteobacteria bacterium]MBU2004684.1 glycosyltransferase family 2 protein [Gammaproteobacteria bacterium]
MKPAPVQILLSTWNGERWLPELLDSLEKQTFQDWQLLVRDDGSTDSTLHILVEWGAQHPDKLSDLMTDGVRIGSKHSFSRLVEASTAPCLFFCDQDDIWFPEKVELQYLALRRLAGEYGGEVPLLVHSDLAVVDQRKKLLSASFWESRGFDSAQRKQAYLLNNVVTGCAAAFNRTAAQMAFPLPQAAMEHDRWLALVCAWFGHVRALQHPLLLYRQHENNQIGAQANASLGSLGERIQAWSMQAEVFLHQFGDRLEGDDQRLVSALAELQHLQGWARRQHILRHRLFKPGVVDNLALLLFG